MSRHRIPAFEGRYEIIVGWDWPMRTYFAQVKDTDVAEGDDDFIRVWIGTSFDEVQNPEELRTPIAAYGTLADNVIAILRADRSGGLGT